MDKILVQWPHLGPYHIARLRMATHLLARHNLHLVALEIYGSDEEYLWERFDQRTGLDHHTLFPEASRRVISRDVLFRELWRFMNHVRPFAVAINGYSTWDAWYLLLWCRLNGSLPILMSDSKRDDAPRNALGEGIKKLIIRHYGSALCAGTPHKKYLRDLGLPFSAIFDGYDAVDNQYFGEQSNRVRQMPQYYRNLPGLADKRTYFLASGRFIARKNFLGLLHAYAKYKAMCQQNQTNHWRLVILGDGPEKEMLCEQIHHLKIAEDVSLPGVQPVTNLAPYYGLAAAFIHPALQDQWGLVVNEAMASGLPVLVSNQAGCSSDLVESASVGFTFDPRDISGLSRLMFRVASGAVDLERMGAAAHQRISDWGLARFATGLYQAVLAGMDRNR
jgi:glycosyltransferase involved in cell wall biosynthesis